MDIYEAIEGYRQRLREDAERKAREEEEDEEEDAPSSPPAHAVEPEQQSPLDARDLSHSDYMTRIRSMLGDAAPHLEERLQPPRVKTDPAVAAAMERDRLERIRAALIRQEEMEEGAVDGRSATPEMMRKRMEDLGLANVVGSGMFSSPPPARPPEADNDGETTRRRRDSDAEVRVRRAMKLAAMNHQPLDVRKFSDAEWAAYCRVRGLKAGYVEGRGVPPDER